MNTPLPENLHTALVDQYNAERYNSAVYASLQAAFEEVNWHGFAAWCGKASAEEMEHARKFFDYLAQRQALVTVGELPKPPEFNGEDISANFTAALELEMSNTAKITSLVRLALDMNDFMTFSATEWAVDEQAKSEAEIVQILSDLAHGDCDAAKIIIDRELGGR